MVEVDVVVVGGTKRSEGRRVSRDGLECTVDRSQGGDGRPNVGKDTSPPANMQDDDGLTCVARPGGGGDADTLKAYMENKRSCFDVTKVNYRIPILFIQNKCIQR